MNLKSLSKIKNKLRHILKKKEVIDIIIFGSFVKGKAQPNDIDVAIIAEKPFDAQLEGFHFSFIKVEEFFKDPPTLATTLLKEGYSLKASKPLAELLRFNSKILFTYSLSNLNNNQKVKIVNQLRGKSKQKGLVEEYKGEWLSNSVFLATLESEYLFEQFFLAQKVKFKKHYLLMH